MRILLTGAGGQLGQTFVQALSDDSANTLIPFARDALDIRLLAAVQAVMYRVQPDVVINTAAYTAVDRAEDEPALADAVNHLGAANLARVCGEMDIPLVHFSTDYVFDGSKQGAWLETDPVSPLGVYGQTKLAGEKAVIANCAKHVILRTSWVFSCFSNNFVKTMLRLGKEREALTVVDDQVGLPTATNEIVRITLAMLERLQDQWGIYHLAQPPAVSWFQFAEAIFTQAKTLGFPLSLQHLAPIPTTSYPTRAQRPANSVLDCDKIARVFNVQIEPWGKSLERVLDQLKSDKTTHE